MSALDAIIIGAGAGGLSSAIALASQGKRVRVYEARSRAGGKIDAIAHDNVCFDTGPSVLTMPFVLEELLAMAGTRLEDELELIQIGPAFRYIYSDGVVLDIAHHKEETLANIHSVLGAKAAREFDAYLEYARTIWEAAYPNFVQASAPNVASMFRLGLTRMRDVMRIDPMRTMWQGITRHVHNPHLRMLCARYATYNGSNPYMAPATLNCIAWVELGMGCFGVKGGMSMLPQALLRVAKKLGVEFYFETPVQKIILGAPGDIQGVELAHGETIKAPVVIANADVAHVLNDLLPKDTSHGVPVSGTPSMSGWTAMLRASNTCSHKRVGHTVLFPSEYKEEFEDIFTRDCLPREPTIYLCAQSVCHQSTSWNSAQPLFIMVNAPSITSGTPRLALEYTQLKEHVLDRIHKAGLMDATDQIIWERTPEELAQDFPGSRGSIYGTASNTQMAAFKRPPNRITKIPGLYLASGSAHPGGGVPLCILSGQAAAREALVHELC